MAETNRCAQCGQSIPPDTPEGLCPNCLLQVALPADDGSQPMSEPAPTTSASDRFVPPRPAELASHFPQLEILELLGRGGMGAVYKGRQKELDRLVAVKILPPEISGDPAFAERFTREARALARLSHPNIVAVYEFGRTGDGLFYFVMEYVDGVNLRQAILSGGMSPEQALAIVPQICDALQFAHDEGIVHRDIKPENILVDKRGRVKIADFGLAKLLGQAPSDVSLTGTQQVMGTLRYMAPEQLEGSKAVDHRADIYSLGVVFYELLTGEVPVGRFAPPSKKVHIDVRLDEVVLRALEEKPEQRYQHASEVKTAVENVTSQQAAPVPPVAAPASPAPIDHVNTLNDFLKAVVIPMLIVAGAWMVMSLALEFLIPWEEKPAHEIKFVLDCLVGPVGVFFLTVAWMRRTGCDWERVVAVAMCFVPIIGFFLVLAVPSRWFGPYESGLPRPSEQAPRPTQPDSTDVRKVTENAATTSSAPAPQFDIRYDKTLMPSVSAPGRQDYAFTFAAPADHVLSVWMEFWQEGKQEFSGLDVTARTKKGKPLVAMLRLSMADGATMSTESVGQKRYDWSLAFADPHAVGGFGSGMSNGEWRKDILGSPGAMTVGGVDNLVLNNDCHPKPGETVTLLWLDAYAGEGAVDTNAHSSLC